MINIKSKSVNSQNNSQILYIKIVQHPNSTIKGPEDPQQKVVAVFDILMCTINFSLEDDIII